MKNQPGLWAPTALLLAGVICVLPCAAEPESSRPAAVNPVCYECFWKYQDPDFRRELTGFYREFSGGDPVIRAEVAYLLARVEGDAAGLCASRRRFDATRSPQLAPSRALLIEETLAFTASECDGDPRPHFRRAAAIARATGDEFKAGVYEAVAGGRFSPRFEENEIKKRIAVPPGVHAYVLGESAIRVTPGWKIGVQVERTVRDWLSYQMAHAFSGKPVRPGDVLTYHEGARLREILRTDRVEALPLSGILAARSGSRWFAADENGLFRFEVLPDKIQYPTTRATDNLALLVDTHGISSLVEPALRKRVDLVIGCGDHPSKAQAAFHLARAGVDVYFPCDRFIGELIGYDAPGTLVGSAPVRTDEAGSVIGDRPILFRVEETVVVEDTRGRGAMQYYDAPARYFTNLGKLLPLRLELVTVTEPGQASRVTRKAVASGASAVALRVWTEEDYVATRDWLARSPAHRAVLFHSAPYPEGNRLFHEFPRQTTFADPRPRFVTAEE